VLVHVFKDEARAGSSVVGRDAFDDLVHLAHQEPRPVDGIIIWALSRFARNLLDGQFHKADLRRRGYELISLSDDLPDGEYAPLIEALIDWKNERFLKDLSRDVKRGLRDLVRQGYAPGGSPPTGFKAEKVTIGRRRDGTPHVVSRWTPDPAKADLVRKAWQMRASGATYKEIHEATRLYRSRGCYASMFANESYRGVLKCGALRIEGGLEALVDEETWEAVQALRRSHTRRLSTPREHPKRKNSPYLLSGLAVCGHCGAAMTGGTDNVARGCPWPYYLCGRKKREGWNSCPTGKINGRVLEYAVLDAVIERVLTPGYVLALVKEVNAALIQDDADIDRETSGVKRQLADVETAIENLLDLAERYGAEAAGKRLLARETEREELVRRLRGLERQRDLRKLQVEPEVIKAVLAEMRGTLEGGNLQAKRVLLRRFVERVEVSKKSARLVYTFPIPGTVLNLVAPWGYCTEAPTDLAAAADRWD
jgi:site-specific DNA recombinase